MPEAGGAGNGGKIDRFDKPMGKLDFVVGFYYRKGIGEKPILPRTGKRV
jgi:hypothetical protein